MTFKRYAISFLLLFVLFWSIGFSNSFYFLNPYYISMNFIPNQLIKLLSSHQFILTLFFFVYFYLIKKRVLLNLIKKEINKDKNKEEATYLSVFMFASLFLSAQFWISEANSFSSYLLYGSIVAIGLLTKIYLHFLSFFIANYNKISLFGSKKTSFIKKMLLTGLTLLNLAMLVSVGLSVGLNTSYYVSHMGNKSMRVTLKQCSDFSFSAPFISNDECQSDEIINTIVAQGNIPLLEKYISQITEHSQSPGYDNIIVMFNDALLTYYNNISDKNWIDSKGNTTQYALQKINYLNYKEDNLNLIKTLKSLVDNKKIDELTSLIINHAPTDNAFKNALMSALTKEYQLASAQ